MALTTDAPVPDEVIDEIAAGDGFSVGRAVRPLSRRWRRDRRRFAYGRIASMRTRPSYSGSAASTRFGGPPRVAAAGPTIGRLGRCVAARPELHRHRHRERTGAVARWNARSQPGPRGSRRSQRAVACVRRRRGAAPASRRRRAR